jgi:hypothetical protein
LFKVFSVQFIILMHLNLSTFPVMDFEFVPYS